jgi:DNA-binding CsgD family transcriptional regulator/pimeloyl-ACP methyl ester carboxylesterase
VTATPATRYAPGPRGALAYQVTGTGPPDLLLVPGMHSHLELQWQLTGYRRFVRGLSRHARLIRYDKLGTGLSDPTGATPTAAERVEDLAAVAAACGAAAPIVLGFSEGGPSARPPTPAAQAELDEVLRGWGTGRSLDTFAPSLAGDAEARRITAFLERAAASPAMIRHVIGALSDSSAAGLLGQLRTPSLVLHRADEFIPVAEAHQLAVLIPGAQLEILPGADHQPWAGDTDAVVERIAVFLDRIRPGPRPAGTGPSRATRPLTGWASLTGAEARVAALAADGYSNPAIARELFLSRGTVETHLKRVYAKLAIDGRHQLHLLRPPAGPG